MTFGVCGDPATAAAAAETGYDFAEWTVEAVLKPREPERTFSSALAPVRDAALAYPVLNCFIPGDLKITGSEVDAAALRTYVTTTMARAERAGIEMIVFGSGGARRIPEGYDPEAAREQLVGFCSMAAPIAGNHGVTIVVEPLNLRECNVLNTVAECAELVMQVSHPALKLLVDAYHLMLDGDSPADVIAYGALIAHTHVATVPNRLAPGAEPCDLAPFFAALNEAGYTGRVSIEAKIAEARVDLPIALAEMKRLAGS